jgi:hypothetical protein
MGQLVLYALSYWVCEKSDGVRVLLFIHTILETNEQSVYIVRVLKYTQSFSYSPPGRPAQYIQGNLRPLLSSS